MYLLNTYWWLTKVVRNKKVANIWSCQIRAYMRETFGKYVWETQNIVFFGLGNKFFIVQGNKETANESQ